jgi:hypothetical protein
MTATKSASLESKQYFDEHKETTKSELHKISSKEDLSDKQKKVLTNLLLDEVKEKQGTEDFKKHAEMRKNDYKKIRELVIQRVGDPKKVTKADIQDAIDFFYGKSEKKESKETSNNLPSDVATQEKKAIAYFEQNNEANHLKVVDHVKKLREEGKFTYEDLWWGKYAVIMPSGSKKLKMYFPADTHLSDTNYDYTDFDGKEITKKETTRGKLWSKEWKKYVEQKEKEWQKMLSESEFKTLIQSLYPEWTQEEQILAFMMATWFYGRMRLSDKTWDYQRAIRCFRHSDYRYFINLINDSTHCSLVHSTFVG